MYKTQHPLYATWRNMVARCKNSKAPNFKYYGGKGVGVCGRWTEFDLWLADMGPRPSAKHRLTRADLDGDYEPSNCKWGLRGEEGQKIVEKAPERWEWALKMGAKVSRPLDSQADAEAQRDRLLEEAEAKGARVALEVVRRQPGDEDWSAFSA